MPTFCHSFPAGLLMALLCVSVARAQQSPQPDSQQPQDQSAEPIPAYRSPLASTAEQDDTGEATNVIPDDRPLSGALNLSLGSPETSRSFWQPRVSVLGTADSYALGSGTGWTAYTSLVGGIDVHKISGHSDLTIGYNGGGSISSDGSIANSIVQEFRFGEKLSTRRFSASFFDNFDDLPETGFGYGGVGGLALPGGGSLTLQPGLTPEGTILTTRGQRIDNSFITELSESLSRRSSFTVLGGYSVLRYLDNNLLDEDALLAQAGYNHQFTRTDTIAVFYRFTQYSFGGSSQRLHDHLAHLSYGRRVTGRLAFQLSAGPEYTLFDVPVVTGGAATASSSTLSWSLSTNLTYQVRRGGLGLSYFHGVSGGSGVLSGALSDTFSGSLTRELSRIVNLRFNGGYARNSALAIPGFSTVGQAYNYGFGGASLSRPWGRSMSLSLSYEAQVQNSNVGFCAGVTCSTNLVRHLISVGFSWHARPMLF